MENCLLQLTKVYCTHAIVSVAEVNNRIKSDMQAYLHQRGRTTVFKTVSIRLPKITTNPSEDELKI